MQQPTAVLDLCFRRILSGKSRDYRDVVVFEKLCFQNVFRPHENSKPAFSNSSGSKSVFQKLCFRDGLVWTARLTVEIKARFQIAILTVTSPIDISVPTRGLLAVKT